MSDEQVSDIRISSEKVKEIRTLNPGDQLTTYMREFKLYHHGIFISHKEGIIDFAGVKSEARVRQVDLLEFTDDGNKKLVRITYPDGQCLPPALVVQNAKEFLANPSKWGPYCVLTNNCEHFAMKCKTGKAVSPQVIEKLKECIRNPLNVFKYRFVSTIVVSDESR